MMDGYKILWKDKKGRRGVGVVLYVKEKCVLRYGCMETMKALGIKTEIIVTMG